MKIGSKELSPRDIQMALVAVGLVVLVAVYFLVFSKYNDKTEVIKGDIETRGTYLNELKGYYDNLDSYQKGVNESKANIEKNLARLPIGMEDDDFLLYMIDLNDSVGVKMSGINFNSPEVVSQFSTMVGGENKDVIGYRRSVSASCSLTYPQFKNYLAKIYDEKSNITYVDSVGLTYDAKEGLLSASFNLSKFYIFYDGAEYVATESPYVALGKKNPFGTIN